MSGNSDYLSVPSTGKLKLKGVKDAKVDKKRKKSKLKSTLSDDQTEDFQDRSVVLKKLEDEDIEMVKESRRNVGMIDSKEVRSGSGVEDEVLGEKLKTEAEQRYDEQRRKRLEERLKREGVKSHKQRVEELNRYLSGLSEHHDMPRIGPG